ncbi:hypothetical protein [Castellaniella sp.]|uniref:hypothetical protein n=1 Tax=Castellaniella sp. TaxID=1955812 RepID=UPI002AFFB248|nr:hypothetical protein [Castellaniella sp.]
MFNHMLTWKKEGSVLVALLAATALLILVLRMFPHLGYVRELTVAGGVLTDANKLRDMLVVPLAVVLQLAVLAVYVVIPSFAPKGLEQERARRVTNLLVALTILLTIGAIFWLGWAERLIPMAAVAATVWGCRQVWKQNGPAMAGWLFLVTTAVSILAWHGIGVRPFWSLSILYPLLAISAFFVGTTWVIIFGVIALLPIAGAVFLSAPGFWMPTSSGISWLDIAFTAIALIVLTQAARTLWDLRILNARSLTITDSSGDLDTLPQPPAFSMALALVLLCASWSATLALPTDDYHFGETLLAYQALVTGQSWFVDFFSPHGISDAFGGLIAHLAGSDTATAISLGTLICQFAIALVVQWRLMVRLGPAGGLLLGLFIPISGKVLFTLLVLQLVIETALIRRPMLAGVCAAILSAAGVFLYGGPTTAAALAGGVGALCVHTLRGGWPAALRFIGGGLVVGLLAVSFAWPQLEGQFTFLKTSAATNLTIYGNGDISVLLDHPQHMLFVLSPLLAVLLVSWGQTGMKQQKGWQQIACLAALVLPVIILILLMNSYAMARLDTSGPRAVMTSCVVLAFLPFWLTCFKGRTQPDARIAAVCGLLLILSYPTPSLRASGPGPLPATPHQNMSEISERLPRLGIGRHNPPHLKRLEDIAETVNLILEPGETFLNLTNRNALHYYLDRPAPVPIASTYNAAPLDFQERNIRALGENPPPLAIVWADNIEHDGISLPLRAHDISSYVMAHYTPFLRNGYVFGIRNDMKDRLSRLPDEKMDFHLLSVNDSNWKGGIAIGNNAKTWSMAVQKNVSLVLKPHDILLFPAADITRRVVAIEGLNVRLDAPLPAGLQSHGEPAVFRIINRPSDQPVAKELWTKAFHQPNLWQVPSAWGRAQAHLSRFLEPIDATFQIVEPKTASEQANIMRNIASGPFRLDAVNPRLILRIVGGLDPSTADILSLNASCVTPGMEPGIAIFWSSDDKTFSKSENLVFQASHSRNLVPLDSSPLWSMGARVQEIRINIRNPELCGTLILSDIRFLKRAEPMHDAGRSGVLP